MGTALLPPAAGRNWRPTAADELLLRAALASGDEAVRAWRAWAASGRIEHLDTGSQRLLPALYRNLCKTGVSDAQLGRLRGAYRQSWYHNQLLFRTGADLLELLHEAEIPTLVFKGAALAVAHYRDVGARPMQDLDILVPPQLARRALDAVESAGWRPVGPHPRDVLAVFHATTLSRRSLLEVADLHWQAFPYATTGQEDLWAAAVPLTLGGVQTQTLSPVDQLLHVIGHGVAWNIVPPVRWVLDAMTVVRSTGDGLDWDRFYAQAKRRDLVYSVAELLSYLRRFGSLEIPEAAVQRLRSAPARRSERALHRARVARPPSLRSWQIHRSAHRALGRLPEAPRLGFVEFLAQRWGLTSRRQLPVHMARKLRELLRRVRHPRA
jgi:hypothetical protein